jgi:hypothetical protein
MKIGILGSGNIGGTLGRHWARAGHEVLFASRHPEQLAGLVREAGPGARAGTLTEAISFSDLLLDALPYAVSLQLDARALTGKVLISAANYYPRRDGQVDLGGRSQTELLASRLPGTRVVKAFNMMFATEMEKRTHGEQHAEVVILLAGDDAEAKARAAQLIREATFAPVDAGGLADGRFFESGGPMYAKYFTASEAQETLRKLKQG